MCNHDRTYGNLRSQPIGRVPSVMDLQALADSSIEIVGPQSTMDIHEQFSQSRSLKCSSVQSIEEQDIDKKEHFGLRPCHANKARQDQQSSGCLDKNETLTRSLGAPDSDGVRSESELDESERIAMEKVEAEHPGWARFDVDIVIKTVVYAGELGDKEGAV